jgi:serine/threonine protein kinase/WD40 repeat protein
MSANFDRIENLFSQALDLRPGERTAFLADACGQNEGLIEQIQKLLQAHEAAEGFLPEEPKHEPAALPLAEKPGDHIGPYKLLEQIGEGGCGVVYMAEQEAPVRRRVALKVIKLGMDTRQVIGRFEAERQALAMMDHPNIAKVFDAGATETGRPYFVMELVRGIKITDYCDLENLATPERLELFMQVCRAIQHAHQKGVIHRDIKPSNILVTVNDGVAVPKVIDFGIAKATQGRLTDQTLFTAFEQFIGTPAYMSPEQTVMTSLDIDTRTDIYSLGVLLYELLTGRTPFDAKDLLASGLDEMRRTIREKEPVRPSMRLSTMVESDLRELAKQRQAVPPKLIHGVRVDLDWIVMKCLEKDRTRRYETANGLARDVQRHLEHEPIVARPASRLYRFQRLVQRNKVGFAAAAAILAALAIGIVASTFEAIRALRAEREKSGLLYDALLGEARAKQLSGRSGQRFESLEAIAKAAAVQSSGALRDEATSCFALPDFRVHKTWEFPSRWVAENLCFDPKYQVYAQRTPSVISVRRTGDNSEVAVLPQPQTTADQRKQSIPRRFDPNGRYLATDFWTADGQMRCQVWDLARPHAPVLDLPEVHYLSQDFTPDGQAIAVAGPDGTVLISEMRSGKERARFHSEGALDCLRISPDGKRLAGLVTDSLYARVYDIATGQIIATLSHNRPLTVLAWDYESHCLATGAQDGQITVWDVLSGNVLAQLEGHRRAVMALAFSHRGDVLASMGLDSTLRLWDLPTRQQSALYFTQDTDLQFSPDDRMVGYALEGSTAKLIECVQSTCFRQLTGLPEAHPAAGLAFSPDGRILAAGGNTGIGFWEIPTGKWIGFLDAMDLNDDMFFRARVGLELIVGSGQGIYRWPLSFESSAGHSCLRVGAPRILLPGARVLSLALDITGDKALCTLDHELLFLDLATPTNILRLPANPQSHASFLGPASRWPSLGSRLNGGTVYDLLTGQVQDLGGLPRSGTVSITGRPDGRWLATVDSTRIRFWRTGSWESGPHSMPGEGSVGTFPLAFSPDGRLPATYRSTHGIQIVQVPGCEPVGTLKPPILTRVDRLSFSPDGTRLAALDAGCRVYLWDLRLLREELNKLKLDWDVPPVPKPTKVPADSPDALQLDAGPFSRAELARSIPPRDSNAPTNSIDLTTFYNAPLTAGWMGNEPEDNLANLPRGLRQLAGVLFDVRGLIQVGQEAWSWQAHWSSDIHPLDRVGIQAGNKLRYPAGGAEDTHPSSLPAVALSSRAGSCLGSPPQQLIGCVSGSIRGWQAARHPNSRRQRPGRLVDTTR